MNKMKKTISEIAKLFNVPVSTLHYWEQANLFKIPRNEENQYRLYSLSDILNIWEIVLYRELGIPVKEIHHLLKEDTHTLMAAYDANEERLKTEISHLERKLEKINKQKSLFNTMKQLECQGLCLGSPDFNSCIRDPFNIESIKSSLENPYQNILYYNAKSNAFERGICSSTIAENMLWHKDNPSRQYIEFLLKVSIESVSENNLKEIKEVISLKGYQTKDVVARYLLIGSENGKRYEYYRAWIEIE